MDPDACLAEIRRLVQSINVGGGSAKTRGNDAWRLAELVESLDDWIMGGGFLPRAWALAQSLARLPDEPTDPDDPLAALEPGIEAEE